jgi:2,4-dienoyl-CoA reductase-like NADH-dependent reductase (Old Yellow Enzyme family)
MILLQPDLPLRLKKGFPLSPYNRDTFYTPEAAAGYVDYPFVNEVEPLAA